jgi:hypothetical protein
VNQVMDTSHLIGRNVHIGANDIVSQQAAAEVIALRYDGRAIALRLVDRLKQGPSSFPYAVATARYEGQSIFEVFEGKPVVCAVTWVTKERFSLTDPFDLSWWRGGPATIAELLP